MQKDCHKEIFSSLLISLLIISFTTVYAFSMASLTSQKSVINENELFKGTKGSIKWTLSI